MVTEALAGPSFPVGWDTQRKERVSPSSLPMMGFKVALRRAVRAVLRRHLPWDKVRMTVTH
jgi:hypothetical protein